MDDLLPRADISGEIASAVAALGSANWKERKAALDEIEAAVAAAGGRIQPGVGDLFPALKGRMADSNKNLVTQVGGRVGRMGGGCRWISGGGGREGGRGPTSPMATRPTNQPRLKTRPGPGPRRQAGQGHGARHRARGARRGGARLQVPHRQQGHGEGRPLLGVGGCCFENVLVWVVACRARVGRKVQSHPSIHPPIHPPIRPRSALPSLR
jgi:hypothetical protein